MIGPIRIMVGSEPKTTLLMMLIALVLMMLVWVMGFRLGQGFVTNM